MSFFTRHAWFAVIAVAFIAAVAFAAASFSHRQSTTWSVSYGTPKHSGTHTTEIKVEYTDKLGKKQSKTIQVTTSINPVTESTSVLKRNKVKAAIDAALAQANNMEAGEALVETGGSGDMTTFTPGTSTATPPNFTNVKLVGLKSDDRETRENDTVYRPTGVKGIGIVRVLGDIVGTAPDGTSSGFDVPTSQGGVSVPLVPGMRKIELLRLLSSGLASQGATTWIDEDSLSLLVLIDGDGEEGLTGIGASCDDIGLTVSCALLANR